MAVRDDCVNVQLEVEVEVAVCGGDVSWGTIVAKHSGWQERISAASPLPALASLPRALWKQHPTSLIPVTLYNALGLTMHVTNP